VRPTIAHVGRCWGFFDIIDWLNLRAEPESFDHQENAVIRSESSTGRPDFALDNSISFFAQIAKFCQVSHDSLNGNPSGFTKSRPLRVGFGSSDLTRVLDMLGIRRFPPEQKSPHEEFQSEAAIFAPRKPLRVYALARGKRS
jgi:hypothetical protein